MKNIKRILCIMMVIVMATALSPNTAEAATKVKLNKKKAILVISKDNPKPTVILKVKGTSKKAKWSSSDKSIAIVKNGKVTGKSDGKVTITCKVGKNKLNCEVRVADRSTSIICSKQKGESTNRLECYGHMAITTENGFTGVGHWERIDGVCYHTFNEGYEYLSEYGCKLHGKSW